MYAAPKLDHPSATIATLKDYNAFLFGIPTRFGNFPGQWKAFIDTTGGLWGEGALTGKYAGLFISSATQGGGQEVTALNSISTLTHHGIIYVPFGYKHAFPLLGNTDEVRGGSPWGAGTFAVISPFPLLYLLFPRMLTLPYRAPKETANPLRQSLSLPLSRGRPFTRPSPVSILIDYMEPLKPQEQKRKTTQKRMMSYQRRRRRILMRRVVLVDCLANALSHKRREREQLILEVGDGDISFPLSIIFLFFGCTFVFFWSLRHWNFLFVSA